MSTTNPAYEYADTGEIEPRDLHRGESNLSKDKEEQECVNKVPEDNASNTVGDGVQHNIVEDENGYESAAEDSKFNIGGGSIGGALGGYAGDDDEDHIIYRY